MIFHENYRISALSWFGWWESHHLHTVLSGKVHSVRCVGRMMEDTDLGIISWLSDYSFCSWSLMNEPPKNFQVKEAVK